MKHLHMLLAIIVLFIFILQALPGTQHWALAKLVLLIVAASATIKAQRHYTNTPSQAKAGLMIASVAYVGIIVLAITKPTLF